MHIYKMECILCIIGSGGIAETAAHTHTHTKNDNMQQVFDRFIYLIDIFDKFSVTPVGSLIPFIPKLNSLKHRCLM